jgi:AcrR family transcriptional regulator
LVPEQPLAIREEILAAAERVIVDRGLGAATTRAIAESAGCAEGSIYRYFPHKHALFVEVIKRRYPDFMNLLASLPDRVGKGSVQKTFEEIVAAALRFYRGLVPLVAGTITERELLEQQRRHFEETDSGPMKVLGGVAEYVRREQREGRISPRISAKHVSRALLGASFGEAFMEEMLGPAIALGTDEQFAKEVVRVLMEGMLPRTRRATARVEPIPTDVVEAKS